MEGFKCNEVMGAMYAFPQLFLPKKAQDEAKVLLFSSYYNFVLYKRYCLIFLYGWITEHANWVNPVFWLATQAGKTTQY